MNIEHKHKSPKRVKSMVINNVCFDQIEEFKTNLLNYMVLTRQAKLDPTFKWELFHKALINCSSNCVEYLLKYHDIKMPSMSHTFNSCKWNKILETYNFMKSLSKKYPDIKFDVNKKQVIERLVNMGKVENNPGRIEYVFELVKNNFFTLSEVRQVINENYVQESKKAPIISLLRELNLRELGIE